MKNGARGYPRSFSVGDGDWRLRFQRLIEGDPNITGLCDASEKLITLKCGLSKKELLDAFCHELVHAIEEEYGFEIPHHLVYKLESGLAAFLRDNAPEVYQLLLAVI